MNVPLVQAVGNWAITAYTARWSLASSVSQLVKRKKGAKGDIRSIFLDTVLVSLCSEGSAGRRMLWLDLRRPQWSEAWLSWDSVYRGEAGMSPRSLVLLLFFSWHRMTGSCIPVCRWLTAATRFSALASPPETGISITTALYFSPFMKFINHKTLDWSWLHLQLPWVVCSCSFPIFLLAKKAALFPPQLPVCSSAREWPVRVYFVLICAESLLSTVCHTSV